MIRYYGNNWLFTLKIDNHLSIEQCVINTEVGALREYIGVNLRAEIDDKNIQQELADSVAKGEMTEDELVKIRNGGKEQEVLDNQGMAEYAMEAMDRDPSVQGLPSVLAGLGMPMSNPYLNNFNQEVLAGNEAPPILTNEQVCERIADGKEIKTDSGIILPN